MNLLGIIGGLGPMATAYFLEQLIQMTDVSCDQEHIPMIIYNLPSIPDRTKHILGLSKEDPSIPMIEAGRKLVGDGVEEIAIPCITASYYHGAIQTALGVPVLNGIRQAGEYLAQRGVKRVGVMATDGTVTCRLFDRELTELGIECIYPEESFQKDVMHLIYENVKAGRAIEMDRFDRVVDHLRQQGVERILLGCTELSVIKRDCGVPDICLDVMEVMARRCVLDMGRNLKKEYENL